MATLKRLGFKEKKMKLFVCPRCGYRLVRRRLCSGPSYECPNPECPVISVFYEYDEPRRNGPVDIRRVKEATVVD